jgi:hypothetical protein
MVFYLLVFLSVCILVNENKKELLSPSLTQLPVVDYHLHFVYPPITLL